jgi:hypothetical protein
MGWREFFAELQKSEQTAATLRLMTVGYSPGATSKVLVVDVENARDLLGETPGLEDVRFIYTPVLNRSDRPDNPCHASVLGMELLTEPLYLSAAQHIALAVSETLDWAKVKPG